jgi:hypothetical protein
MIRGRLVKGLALLAVLALLSLIATGCMPALQQLIGMDRGGVSQDKQVAALDSDQSGDSGDEDENQAQVEQLQGREKSKAVWGAFRDEEVRELGRLLQQQGLRLNLREAEAYEVTSTEESEAEAEALGMEVTGDEGDETGTLVDVPLGDSGHLLQVSNGDADHTWAEIEGEDGELTYIDIEEEAHFIIPDEETEQELLEALQQDPAYQGLLDELEAQGANVADVQVVIDEDTGEAHFLVETTHDDGEAQGEWFGAGFRRPRIDGTYALHFPVKRVGGPRRFQPVSPAVRRPMRELLEDRHSRARLAVLYGGKRHDTSRLKRAVFWHEFIRHTKLTVDATKVWLGDFEDKQAFGRPEDPFTYKIRLKRAPWLQTKLQLELLDGCDSGDWVPKATQIVQPGQVEVAWDRVVMAGDWNREHGGKVCKFRVRDLQNGRTLGPYDGPRLRRLISKEDVYHAHHALTSTHNPLAEGYDEPPALFLYGREMNYMFYGFRNLDAATVKEITSTMFLTRAEAFTGTEDRLTDGDGLTVRVSDRVLQILKNIAESIIEAIAAGEDREEALKAALNEYKDDQEFQEFLYDFELWAEFKNLTLEEALSILFDFLDPQLNDIVDWYPNFNPDIALNIIKYLGAQGALAIVEAYYYILQTGSPDILPTPGVTPPYPPTDEYRRASWVWSFIQYLDRLVSIIKSDEVMTGLIERLEELMLRTSADDTAAFVTGFLKFRAEAGTAVNLYAKGWALIDLWQNIGNTTVDIIAFQDVPGLGKTTIFVEVLWNGEIDFSIPEDDPMKNPITQRISEIIKYVKNHKPVTTSDMDVVQIIGLAAASGQWSVTEVQNWLAQFEDSRVPVLVVWIDTNGNIYYAYENMEPGQAEALLESEGFYGCGSNSCQGYNGDLDELATGDVLTVIAPNPDDPPEGDSSVDPPICFGGYCIESEHLQFTE